MTTIAFSSENLQFLLADLPEAQSGQLNPQAQRLRTAQQDINLAYVSREILAPSPPTLSSPQRIVSMRIDGSVYLNVVDWSRRWREIYNQNRQQGLALVTRIEADSEHVVTARGQPLANPIVLATTETETATGIVTTTSTQRALRGIQQVTVDDQGFLEIAYTDGTRSTTGPVLAPPNTFSIGTVTAVDFGLGTQVSIQGSAPAFQLNFQLERAEADLTAVRVTDTYSDPSWLTISQGFVGLDQVTNESKATMFTNPQFTGLAGFDQAEITGGVAVSTILDLTGDFVHTGDQDIAGTVSVTGSILINNQPVITQPTIIALGLAF